MNHHISRKHVAVALAPVAGLVGIGVSATAAHAEESSNNFSFVATADDGGEIHTCSVLYDLLYDDQNESLSAHVQSEGDPECSSGFAEVFVNYEQANGDNTRVFSHVSGLGAFALGEWDNVRNVDHISDHKIQASYTENYDSRCDPVATLAMFGHDCTANFTLSHGK